MYERIQMRVQRYGLSVEDFAALIVGLSVEAQKENTVVWHAVAATREYLDQIIKEKYVQKVEQQAQFVEAGAA